MGFNLGESLHFGLYQDHANSISYVVKKTVHLQYFVVRLTVNCILFHHAQRTSDRIHDSGLKKRSEFQSQIIIIIIILIYLTFLKLKRPMINFSKSEQSICTGSVFLIFYFK